MQVAIIIKAKEAIHLEMGYLGGIQGRVAGMG